MTEEYDPYIIGRNLYQNGYGVSDIWGAVKQDSDMDECYRGYCDQQWEERKNEQN